MVNHALSWAVVGGILGLLKFIIKDWMGLVEEGVPAHYLPKYIWNHIVQDGWFNGVVWAIVSGLVSPLLPPVHTFI